MPRSARFLDEEGLKSIYKPTIRERFAASRDRYVRRCAKLSETALRSP